MKKYLLPLSLGVTLAFVAAVPLFAQQALSNEYNTMPSSVTRQKVTGIAPGLTAEVTAGSIFWLNGSAKVSWLTSSKNPTIFSGALDFLKARDIAKQQSGGELVLAFAAAYKAPSGSIEGVAYQKGQAVGQSTYSKTGFVYITPAGKIELYRYATTNSNGATVVDTTQADALVARAQQEKGSLFQQIPAIWDGVKRVNSTSTSPYLWRALVRTTSGQIGVLNVDLNYTQNQFLDMALALKDASGNKLIDDLILLDTGVFSYGIFRDNEQITADAANNQFSANVMEDAAFPNYKDYTNILVIGQ